MPDTPGRITEFQEAADKLGELRTELTQKLDDINGDFAEHWEEILLARTRDASERNFWLRIRQAALIVLGAIEEYRDLERSVTPKHKRERQDNVPDVRS